MAINPETTTTVKVSELASAGFNTTDLVPHEVGGYLKKGTLQDLATFIGGIISTEGSVAFKAVNVTDGQTLPATTTEEFILVGPGTYPNVGGGSPVTTTEALNALVSNGTYWFIGVEIPIGATGVWGSIEGTLDDQTDLIDALDLKADLVDGKVPASQLPSYVDDVVEVANFAALPVTGETGKIYITIDNNKVYRWSGSAYIEIAADKATWGLIDGTLSNQTDLQNALNAKFNNPTGNTTQYIAGDGSLVSFPIAGQAGTIVREIRNTTGSTLAKGTIVYISGASGNKPTVSKAIATGDSTSAQTFGMVQASISNNSNGYVVCMGDLTGLDTSAISEGAQLYLSSTTAGAYTTTKQLAPAHLVYIGVVTRSHATLGQIEVKIQNGYELDEIHDVAISSKTNKDFLVYESASSLWKNKSLGTVLAGTSSQFVKGDGSLDSNTYALTSQLHDAVTIGTANGLSLSTQVLSLGLASTSANGALSSTDWNTFNGKQNALTNPVTGTGTTNYIPKFTGASAIGNSLIFDNGTNVGIGTATPSGKLHVSGGYVTINEDGAGTRNMYLRTSYDTNLAAIQVASAIDFVIANSNTERFRITSGGNVLIGTTTDAGYKLDVNGSTRLNGTATIATSLSVGGDIDASNANIKLYSFQNSPGQYRYIGTQYAPGNGNNKAEIRFGIDGADTRTKITFHVANGAGTINEALSIGYTGASTFSSSVTATGFFNSSDNRLKELTDYDYNVSDIKPITYLWKDGRDDKKHVGYSAQEVKKVMPDAVNEDEKGFLSVNYVEVLVAKIEAMEKEIAYLKSKI